MDENNSRVSNFRKMQIFHAAALLSGYSYFSKDQGPGEPTTPVRPCINCGKEKQHNNAYCSGDCCREHREKKKLNTVSLRVGGKRDLRISSNQPNLSKGSG